MTVPLRCPAHPKCADGVAFRGTGRWATPVVDDGWVIAAGNLTFDGTDDGFSIVSSMNGSAVSLCDLMSG